MDLRIDSDNRITGKEKLSGNPWDQNAEKPSAKSTELEFGGLKTRPKRPAAEPKLQETPIVKKRPVEPIREESPAQASPSAERPRREPVRRQEDPVPYEIMEQMLSAGEREDHVDPEEYQEILERERRRKKNIIKASVIAAVVFIVGILGFLTYRLLRVEEIVVLGNEKLSAEYVTELSSLKKGQHVFAIDMDAMETGINSDPRIEFEKMDYEFPNRVVLNIVECMPVARFEIDGGNSLLIDKNGKAIAVADAKGEGLAMVKGLHVSKYSIGYDVRTEDTYKQKVLCELLGVLSAADYTEKITEINIESTSNIKLFNRNGMEICYGSAEDFELKTKWAKIVIEKLAEKGLTDGKVDVYAKDQAIYSRPDEPKSEGVTLNYIDIQYDDPVEMDDLQTEE